MLQLDSVASGFFSMSDFFVAGGRSHQDLVRISTAASSMRYVLLTLLSSAETMIFLHAIHIGSNSIIKIMEPHTAQARVQQGEGAPQKLAFEREQSSLQQGD
jgi:hypothetical protein